MINIARFLIGLLAIYLLAALMMGDLAMPLVGMVFVLACTNFGALLFLIIPLAWLVGWAILAVIQSMRRGTPAEVTP
jgi:hypothetical protein